MKNKIIIAVVAIILISTAAWYQKNSENTDPNLKCFDSPKYFAVQRNIGSSVGSDIVIKVKANENQKFVCKYAVSANDFEIRNVVAEYFEFFTNNFAILDSGTGPDGRRVIAYNLQNRQKMFEDEYSRPLTSNGDVLSYWTSTDTKPTNQNCPDLKKYTDGGLGAAIEREVQIDLNTMSRTYGAEIRCSARQ